MFDPAVVAAVQAGVGGLDVQLSRCAAEYKSAAYLGLLHRYGSISA
ncbi:MULTISPECIES: hypothetical protein [Kribbella]